VSDYLNTLRRFSRDVRLMLVTSALLGFTVFGGIYSVLLNLYLLRLGYGPEFVGQVNAAGALAFAAFGLPAGALGRRWGSRRTLIAGMSLASAGYFLLPLAEFVPADWREGWLLATCAFGVLGLTTYLVNSAPFLMAHTRPSERSYVFSTQVALWPLAGFAGSLVGGFLPNWFTAALGISPDHPAAYRAPLLIAAGLLLLAVIALGATREVEAGHRQQTAAEGGRPPLVLIGVAATVTFLQMTAESSSRTFFNVYMDDGLGAPTPLIGALVASGQILAFVAALLTPLLAARWGRTRTIVFGSLGMVACLLPLAVVPHWAAAGLGCMGLIAAGSIRRSVFILFQQELVPTRWRVTINSILTSSFGVSAAAVAFGGGYLIAALGYRTLFLTAAGLTAAGTLVFWSYFRVPRGEYARGVYTGRPGC